MVSDRDDGLTIIPMAIPDLLVFLEMKKGFMVLLFDIRLKLYSRF